MCCINSRHVQRDHQPTPQLVPFKQGRQDADPVRANERLHQPHQFTQQNCVAAPARPASSGCTRLPRSETRSAASADSRALTVLKVNGSQLCETSGSPSTSGASSARLAVWLAFRCSGSTRDKVQRQPRTVHLIHPNHIRPADLELGPLRPRFHGRLRRRRRGNHHAGALMRQKGERYAKHVYELRLEQAQSGPTS